MRARSGRVGPRGRGGFTLVEMLVVMVVVILLLSLVAMIGPGLSEKRAAERAADQIQGWLLQARSRAVRNQAPVGLRLIPEISSVSGQLTGAVRSMEFVEQPSPLMPLQNSGASAGLPCPLQVAPGNPTANPPTEAWIATIVGWSITQNPGAIQQGDYLEISQATTSMHRIQIAVPNPQNASNTDIILASPPPPNGLPGSQPPYAGAGNGITEALLQPLVLSSGGWRIIRRWRAMPGEPALQLPVRTQVDLVKNQPPPNPNPNPDQNNFYNRPLPSDPVTNDIVIMFSPTGALLDAPNGAAILWVRNDNDAMPDPTLVVVYARTGSVASHPVDTTPANGMMFRFNNPYTFTADGLNSGL